MKKILASIFLAALLIPNISFGAYTFSQGGTNFTGPYASGTAIVSNGTNFYGMATSSLGLPTFTSLLDYVTTAGTQTITGLKTFTLFPEVSGTPTTSNQLVNKAYTDALFTTGSRFVDTATAGTTTTLPANTYNNGASGVGATLTGNSNGALTAQDGITLTAGQTLLVKDEATQANNGYYTVTTVGNAGTPYVLTRVANYDVQAEIETGTFFNILSGTTNANRQYIMNNNSTITVGTTAITFALLSASNVYTASSGISLSGFNFVLNLLFNGGLGISGGQVYVDTDDSTIDLPTAASNKIRIKDLGVTAAKLAVGAVDLATTKVTGILGITKGGTGLSATPTNGQLPIGNGTGYTLSTITAGSNVTVTNGAGSITIAATGGSGGGSATTTFGATVVPVDFIASAVTNQAMGVTPAGDQEFGSTAGASSTISRRPYNLTRGDSFYLTARQTVAGVAAETLRLQCSTDQITWTDASESSVTLPIALTTPVPKSSNWSTLAAACKSDVWLRLVANGGNSVANPAFRNITAMFRLTQPAAGQTATTTIPLNFLSVTTQQVMTNMAAATTSQAFSYFDTTNATQYRLAKNQTVAGFATARFGLECSNDGTTFIEATSDDNKYLSAVAVGRATSTTYSLVPQCVGNKIWRLISQGGNGVVDPAFTYLSAQFNTTEQALGTTADWIASSTYNTAVITPTTSIGVWTKAPFFASSTSYFSGVMNALSDLLVTGNVGIATSSPFAKLSVDGRVAFQGDSFATTTIGNRNTSLTISEKNIDGGLGTIRIPVLTGRTITSSLGELNSLALDNEFILFENSSLNTGPSLSFASADFGNTGNSISLNFATGTPALNLNGNFEIQNTDNNPKLTFYTTDKATSSLIQLTNDDNLLFTGATSGYYFDSAVAILANSGNNMVFGSTDGSIISAIAFATSTDQMQFIQASGGYYFDGNVGIGTTTPFSKLHVSSGASATTTVSIGEIGLSTSRGCVNMNRSDGGPGSFYLNPAGVLTSESNYCR